MTQLARDGSKWVAEGWTVTTTPDGAPWVVEGTPCIAKHPRQCGPPLQEAITAKVAPTPHNPIDWFETHTFNCTDPHLGGLEKGWEFWEDRGGREAEWKTAMLAALVPELQDLERLRPRGIPAQGSLKGSVVDLGDEQPAPPKRKQPELPSTLFHDEAPLEKKKKPSPEAASGPPAFVIPSHVDDEALARPPTMLFQSKTSTPPAKEVLFIAHMSIYGNNH